MWFLFMVKVLVILFYNYVRKDAISLNSIFKKACLIFKKSNCCQVSLSLRLEGEGSLKYRFICRPLCGKVQYSK